MASSSQNTGSGTRLGRRVRACLLSGELLEVELSPGSGAEEVRSQVAQRLGRHRFEVALLQDGKKLQDCDPVLGDVSVLVQPFLSQDVIDELIHNMRAAGVAFSEGMTDEEVRQAEENCKIRFPPDLKLFLQTAMPEGPEFPNWRRTVAVSVHDHHAVMRDDIHARLGGVQSFWYTEWGPRPEDRTERASLTARHLKGVPRLIPVYRHHFVVSGTPAGQPVLGVADPCRMCLLATDLAAYFSLIFNFRPVRPYLNCPVVTATFWGEIEKWDIACSTRTVNVICLTPGVCLAYAGPLRIESMPESAAQTHLDPIEQRRFAEGSGFRYPDRPHVVITASRDMGRTASTWVFNATRLLFRQAKEACDSYWMRCLDRSKIQHRLETGAHVVIKTHEWTGEMSKASFDEVSPLFTHVIVSVRQGFAEDPAWMKVATHVIHFEELVAYDKDHPEDPAKIGAISVLRKLANHLGLSSLTEHDLRCVDYDLMTLPMPRFGCDQTTKLWPFHGRRGGRPIPRLDPRSE
ncbi:unnamed protein product [Symbiodinium necroappetens]|uniref:Knr4/Smi1-like domain-containing protein n=1 Tax=Symbiodinium necroappetens TaxID=1628268 RepID=A0A812IS15_9DINO|nr:unnamed protein product [Symbiodinium necroappetens]